MAFFQSFTGWTNYPTLYFNFSDLVYTKIGKSLYAHKRTESKNAIMRKEKCKSCFQYILFIQAFVCMVVGGGGEQVGHTCNNLCHDRLTDQLLTSKISLFAYQNKQIETDY